jgi:tripartite ATP-independent transporter DctM subunit
MAAIESTRVSAIPEDASAATLQADLGWIGRALAALIAIVEHLCAAVLALDVAIVFASVIFRYFLRQPLDWAEEVARALMVTQVFLGAATVVGRRGHAGMEVLRGVFPRAWRPYVAHMAAWFVAAIAAAVFVSSIDLLVDSEGQTTPFGLPSWIFVYPVTIGSFLMCLLAAAVAFAGPRTTVWLSFGAAVGATLIVYGWSLLVPSAAPSPFALMIIGFFGGLFAGMPIAFVLAFSALLYFLADPSLPMSIYAQQLMAGCDHFVLLAVPFFVLAGLTMEVNGMSARLVELLLRIMGRLRGGLNLILIVATAFFSGISGSKLADIAAVGGIVMPAVRRTGQDPDDAAALLASSAIMAETIPPCVNMIIFGFVANVSIGGLFIAGLAPAALLAAGLAAMAVAFGNRIDPRLAFPQQRPLLPLLAGALVALVMVALIGRGVTSGIATSTEISAFAVVYALLVGGAAFRELNLRAIIRLFVRSATMASGILFIVAAASSFSFALTIEQIPRLLTDGLTAFGLANGRAAFLLVAAALMIGFGSILEGAPALIIWGPLLTPIAQNLGVNPLHFGTVMVIAMGLGLFSPPLGLGSYATCAIAGTKPTRLMRPMLKYLAVLVVGLLILIFAPEVSLWLPRRFGLS